MRKRMVLNLALAIFLLLAAGAIFFVIQNEKRQPIEIERESEKTQQKPATEENYGNLPEPEPEKENKDIDLAWAVERYKGKEIVKINTTEKKVAFTFDAGANADGVDKVLEILAENNIKGTFFLTGKFIEKFPDKVQKMIATGGDIGNHTYDHQYLTSLTNEQIKDEIQKTEDTLARLESGDKFKPLLRPPYGSRNQSTKDAISNNGYINIQWTIDSLGWKGTSGGQTKDSVEQKVLKNTSSGAIIMMHLGSNPDDKTHLDSQALPDIISKLKEDGYEFVTLSELLELQK